MHQSTCKQCYFFPKISKSVDSKTKKYQNRGTMTRDCVMMEIKAEEGIICSTLDQAGVKAIYPSSSCDEVYENKSYISGFCPVLLVNNYLYN